MREEVKNDLLEKKIVDDKGNIKRIPRDLYIDSNGTLRLKSEKTKGFFWLRELIRRANWAVGW